MLRILIVDDEPAFAAGIADFLGLQGHDVATVGSLASARVALAESQPDVVLLDLMLPDGNGLELMDRFADRPPQKIIVTTGHAGVASLIGGMAGDGVMYLRKPIEARDLVAILNTLTPADEQPTEKPGSPHIGLLVGESKAIQRVYHMIRKVAGTDSTVFIHGESGTGKELVADAIHRLSHRAGPFIPVNCGGLTKDLMATQLFGHEKGSFTGANRRHQGFFERAQGGTLFLDEITEMPIDMQTHLLRVLETGTVLRVGAEQEIPIDARLVAATNRDPLGAVRDGSLREDLYFRLCVFPIELPPLRDRHGDIYWLAELFLRELNRKYGTNIRLTPDVLEQLEAHAWPGNVRELKHAMHRAYILAEGDEIEAPDHFDDYSKPENEGALLAGRSIADVEKQLIYATLEKVRGNRRAAAATLGVSLKTLYNRLKEYGDVAD